MYSSTTPRDFEAAAWLLSRGADLAVVSRLITRVMGREQLKALSAMLENTQARDIGGGVVMAISSMQSETFLDDFAPSLPHHGIEDCSVLFAIASMEDKVQSWVAAAPPSWTWRNLPQARRRRTLLCRFASVKDMTLPRCATFSKCRLRSS